MCAGMEVVLWVLVPGSHTPLHPKAALCMGQGLRCMLTSVLTQGVSGLRCLQACAMEGEQPAASG